MLTLRFSSLGLGLLLLLFASGCGPDSGRYGIQGTIKLGDTPLNSGTIHFEPATRGLKTAGGALITSGEYAIPISKGLEPGEYTVRISSPKVGTVSTEPALPGESGPAAQDRIPARYNVQTTLKCRVEARPDNRFDLNIPADSK